MLAQCTYATVVVVVVVLLSHDAAPEFPLLMIEMSSGLELGIEILHANTISLYHTKSRDRQERKRGAQKQQS